MRNLNVVAIECMRELEIIGIKCGNVIKLEANTRAMKRWGQCTCLGGNNYAISINVILLRDDTNIDGLKNTIIHELLHTCPNCMKHTGEWKELAEKVNKYYGYNIKRVSSSDEKGVEPEAKRLINAKKKEAKYKFQCCNCGIIVSRKRASDFTKNPNNYRCGKCGGKFKKIK